MAASIAATAKAKDTGSVGTFSLVLVAGVSSKATSPKPVYVVEDCTALTVSRTDLTPVILMSRNRPLHISRLDAVLV